MTTIPDAALTTIRAALQDAEPLHENHDLTARRIVQYLISSGYHITITDDPDTQPAAA